MLPLLSPLRSSGGVVAMGAVGAVAVSVAPRRVAASQLRRTLPRRALATQATATTTATTTATAKKSQCWSCRAPLHCCASVCEACGKVQKPATPSHETCSDCSHFDVLGVEASYVLDEKQLEKKYKDLLMKTHPDKQGPSATEEERSAAEQMSVAINQAFAVLKNPVKRAIYMLQRRGVNAMEEKVPATDFSILTEAMNLREELESTAPEALAPLRKRLQTSIEALQRELAAAIGDPAQIDQAVKTAVRMRFLEKVLEEVEEKRVVS